MYLKKLRYIKMTTKESGKALEKAKKIKGGN